VGAQASLGTPPCKADTLPPNCLVVRRIPSPELTVPSGAVLEHHLLMKAEKLCLQVSVHGRDGRTHDPGGRRQIFQVLSTCICR
jgi:hypothetical protein